MSGQTLPRLQIKNVPGAEAWVLPVLQQINLISDRLNELANKGITIREQLPGNVVEMEVRTTADYSVAPIGFSRVKFPHGLVARRALGVFVLQVKDKDFPNAALAGPHSCTGSWRESGLEILVDWISGLEASHRYDVRFWVVA